MQHRVISKSVFAEVLELISSGQLAEAERICNNTISRHPNDPNITGLLGALLVKITANCILVMILVKEFTFPMTTAR